MKAAAFCGWHGFGLGMEIIRGEFLRFLSPPGATGSGLALARYESSGQLLDTKIGGPFPPMIQPGEWFVAEGDWRENTWRERRELVFQAKSVQPDLPVTQAGAEQIFRSTFSAPEHGVTPAAIKEFVASLGAGAALASEKDPQLLMRLTSDSSRFGAAILRDWSKRISSRAPIRLMQAAGVGEEAMRAILRRHRDNTMAEIEGNPYTLASVPGVGFAEADKIGMHLGIAATDPRRVVAAVHDCIDVSGGEGNTYVPFAEVASGLARHEVSEEAVRKLYATGAEGLVFMRGGDGLLAQKQSWFKCEENIADKVSGLLARGRASPRSDIDSVSERILSQDKYARFDPVQRQAVLTSARESVAILTGGPGTGKSTVTEAIAEIAAATAKGPVILMAPTGKAARRLEETTGRRASTVHRALGAKGDGGGEFTRNESNPLPAGCFVIVDEASMLDIEIASALLSALPEDGRILFVGDRHQLPSVGPGYVLGDMIAARAPNGMRVPCSELVNVYRSDKQSQIALKAAEIREGSFEAGRLDNVMRGGVMMYDLEGKAIVDWIVKLVTKLVPKSLGIEDLTEIAVLCPQRTGTGGTYELNAALSRVINPDGREIPGLHHAAGRDRREPLPRVGDRVMLTRNDYDNDVMNGDVGKITGVFMETVGKSKVTKVKVEFDSGQTVAYPVGKCRDLILAYAITGHKSQGSQYRCVIMPFSRDHRNMLDRTLVYTEWTRAKDFLILVGEKEVMAEATAKVTAGDRKTQLRHLMSTRLATLPSPEGVPVAAEDFVPPRTEAPRRPAPPGAVFMPGRKPSPPAAPVSPRPAPMPFRSFRPAAPKPSSPEQEDETKLPTP